MCIYRAAKRRIVEVMSLTADAQHATREHVSRISSLQSETEDSTTVKQQLLLEAARGDIHISEFLVWNESAMLLFMNQARQASSTRLSTIGSHVPIRETDMMISECRSSLPCGSRHSSTLPPLILHRRRRRRLLLSLTLSCWYSCRNRERITQWYQCIRWSIS